jgi:hypothetical protein
MDAPEGEGLPVPRMDIEDSTSITWLRRVLGAPSITYADVQHGFVL